MYRMEKQSLRSSVDGLPLSVLIALPEQEEGGDLRGVVQLLHGMCEYKERYLPLIAFLTERGYACVIHDHRGHGESIRSSQDLGYMYGAGSDGLVKDALLVNEYARQRFPGLPMTLFGHSMGSLVARCFVKTYEGLVDKVILTGPPSDNPAVGAGLLLAKLQRRLFGGHKRGKLLKMLSFGAYVKQYPESRCAWVCSDMDVVSAYEKDPLCAFTFTVDGYVALFELMRGTYRSGWVTGVPNLPIRYLGGAEDPCIGGEQLFEAEMAHMRACGCINVSGKLYPGMRHEICNERGREEVYREIADFLQGNG